MFGYRNQFTIYIYELVKDHPIISIIVVCIIILSSKDNKRQMHRANDLWNIRDKKFILRENNRRRQDYNSNITGWIIVIIFGVLYYTEDIHC